MGWNLVRVVAWCMPVHVFAEWCPLHSVAFEDKSDMHSVTAGIDFKCHASSQSMYPVYTYVGRTLLSCSSLACLILA